MTNVFTIGSKDMACKGMVGSFVDQAKVAAPVIVTIPTILKFWLVSILLVLLAYKDINAAPFGSTTIKVEALEYLESSVPASEIFTDVLVAPIGTCPRRSDCDIVTAINVRGHADKITGLA